MGPRGLDPSRPDDRASAPLRFLTEIIAWVAAPWALAQVSWVLAVVSVVVLIGLPTLFATPGDKANVMVAVPGRVTIALVLLHVAVAIVAAWIAWPVWAAVPATIVAAATCVTERGRWRWLLSRPATP